MTVDENMAGFYPNVGNSALARFPTYTPFMGQYLDNAYPQSYPAFIADIAFADALSPTGLGLMSNEADVGIDSRRWRP